MMAWFFGFKLHIVINNYTEIIQWTLTQGNTDDCELLKNKNFTQKLFGKLFADKGYIRQDLFAPPLFLGGMTYTKSKDCFPQGLARPVWNIVGGGFPLFRL